MLCLQRSLRHGADELTELKVCRERGTEPSPNMPTKKVIEEIAFKSAQYGKNELKRHRTDMLTKLKISYERAVEIILLQYNQIKKQLYANVHFEIITGHKHTH